MTGDGGAVLGAHSQFFIGPFVSDFLRHLPEWLGCKASTRGKQA